MSEIFLTAKNITKSFSGLTALKRVNLTINHGEIRCLVGENGSGKSTLIKIISGVYKPDDGEIIINGRCFKYLHPIDSIREGIQVIYQDFSIFPNLTVAENLALNDEIERNKHFINWKEVNKIAREAIERIGLEVDLNIKVESLSVAKKQLIAISRALLQDAKLIIMDEPTTALTRKEVESLFEIVKNLQHEGISTLFVSHKLNEVLEISEKVTILRNGKSVADGDISDFDRENIVFFMTGRKIIESSYSYEGSKKDSNILLKVKNLTRKGKFEDVNFEIFTGEILGITGLLGSGRTELALALFGLNPADSGKIYINGKLIKIKSTQDAINNGIGYLPEDRLTEGIFLEQSIGRNVIITILKSIINRLGILDNIKIEKQINKWVKDLNIITPSYHLPVKTLSGGNQQRIVLAKWIAAKVRILILNGPTVGVDVGSKMDIHKKLRELASSGIGIIIISDDIPEILQNCNRILIMHRGRIIDEVLGKDTTEEDMLVKILNQVK